MIAALVSGRPETSDDERAFVDFPHSDTLRWESLDAAAPLRLSGEGEYWLTFRAFSPGTPARLRVRTDQADLFAVRVSRAPRGYVAGPVDLDGLRRYWLEPVPSGAADRGSTRVEVFLSELRLARRPVAALPLRGFWDT